MSELSETEDRPESVALGVAPTVGPLLANCNIAIGLGEECKIMRTYRDSANLRTLSDVPTRARSLLTFVERPARLLPKILRRRITAETNAEFW